MDVISVNPPDDMLAEAWLEQYDSTPTLLPQWPESRRMALVCIRNTGEGSDGSEAFVVLSPEHLTECSDPVKLSLQRLFFRVPRSILLADPDLCPGLTPESFWRREP